MITAATNMTAILLSQFEKSSFIHIFAALARAALRITDERTFNVTLESMRRILKHQPITQAMTVGFASRIMHEAHPLFEKQPLCHWLCPRTPLFAYFTTIITKYPKGVNSLVPPLVRLANQLSDDMFTIAFDPIAAAYGAGLVRELPAERLYNVCYRDVFTRHSTVGLSYVLEKVTDQITEFTAQLCAEWRGIKKSQMLWKCAVADALFQLSARGQKIGLDILQLILEEFPYRADLGFGEALCQNILNAFEANNDLEPIELTLLKKFSDFFLLDQPDFLAYHVPYELQMSMKALMRNIFKKNKSYEREMNKYYVGNKTKINKFTLLVQ
jgi:hypothetical protein